MPFFLTHLGIRFLVLNWLYLPASYKFSALRISLLKLGGAVNSSSEDPEYHTVKSLSLLYNMWQNNCILCLFYIFLFFKDFLIWKIKKKILYWICYNTPSILYFGSLSLEACVILAPRPGIEPAPPALEGEVITTGPPGKSLHFS